MSDNSVKHTRGRVRTGIYLAASFLAGLLIALATGYPQIALAEFEASRRLGGTVTIDGLRTFGSIRADRIEIAGRSADGGLLEPVAILEGVVVEYRLPGISDRMIGSVHAEAVHLNFQARSGGESNFAFLSDRPVPEATDQRLDPMLLPERIRVDAFDLTAAIGDSMVAVDDLSLESGFPGTDSATVEIAGTGSDVRFAGLVDELESTSVSGDFAVSARIDGNALTATVSALLDRTGDVQLMARGELDRSWLDSGAALTSVDIRLDSASLDGEPIAGFVAGLTGGEARFGTIVAEPSRVTIDFSEGAGLPAIQGGALVQGLQLGSDAAPIYEGDLTLRADVPGGQVPSGVVSVSLDEENELTAEIEGSRETGTMLVRGDGWARDRLAALVPPQARIVVDRLDFDRADLWGTVDWNEAGVLSRGRMTAAGAEQPVATYVAELPEEGDWQVEGHLRIGSGTAEAKFHGRGSDSFDLESTFTDLSAEDALVLASGAAPSAAINGTVSGEFHAQSRPESEYYTFDGKAAVTQFELEPAVFERIDLELQGRLDRAAERAELSHVTVSTGDGITQANFTDIIVRMDPLLVSANVLGGFDLAHAGRWYETPELFGDFEVEGQVGFDGSFVRMPLTLRCGTLGYGETVLPYGTKIVAEIETRYEPDGARGMLDGCTIAIGDGTRVLISQGTFGFDPASVGRIQFEVDTDFAVLAKMGLFNSAEGTGRLAGNLSYDDALHMEWQFASDLANAVFPEEIAAVQGVVARASGTYEGGLQGSGEIRIDQIIASGGHITGLGGAMTIANSVVSIPDLRGDVFGGRFVGQIEAQILEAGLPARISGRLSEFDLARFTEEVQPPETRLTGTADGTFVVRNSLEGLTDLEVYATCDQNFTLNRDMVQKILQSEAFAATLGINQIEKTVSKFLGDADQRPFESANLQLRDEGDRLRGTAVLLSQKTDEYNGLNLTIELAMDQEALIETLKMLQENEIANVQF